MKKEPKKNRTKELLDKVRKKLVPPSRWHEDITKYDRKKEKKIEEEDDES